MHLSRPLAARPLLAPLGAMVAIGVVAAYLVATQPDTAQPAVAPVAVTLDGAAAPSQAARPRAATTRLKASALYRFLLLQPDGVTPIRWDPCRAVHYRIALDGRVPASEIPHVQRAFVAAGAALGGVRFAYDGQTSVIPDAVDDSSRADTDVVFAFALPGTGPARSRLLSGWEAGRGGFAAAGPASAAGTIVERPTHGSVVIDAEKWAQMTRHDRAVLYLHEIGHVVGLDHPADTRQIMSSGAYDLPARYQKGDLAGLAQLGRQAGCTP